LSLITLSQDLLTVAGTIS